MNRELRIDVHYPLPYKSAERFQKSDRATFINKMTDLHIAKAIRPYIGSGLQLVRLNKLLEDPRHVDEIKMEKLKSALVDFFKQLIPKRKDKSVSRYRDYL